jgi:two-component system chemotaxis response regulator CheY
MSDSDVSLSGPLDGETGARPARATSPVDTIQRGLPAARGVPRVMLIEDDFILRAHLAELMMIEGYVVTCAADGAEALRRLRNEPTPSLILMDIVLPRVDGIAFRKAQLRDPVLGQIPTIAMSALKDIGDIRGLAFSAVIRKPLNFNRLMDVMAGACPLA